MLSPEERALEIVPADCQPDFRSGGDITDGRRLREEIAAAIRAAVDEEREECAKVADGYDGTDDDSFPAGAIAADIRARGPHAQPG